MSVVPYTTQIGPRNSTGVGQDEEESIEPIIVIHTDEMTERQSSLITEMQKFLFGKVPAMPEKEDQIHRLPKYLKHFVIPQYREDLIERINSHFDKALIYLPRAVIEARSQYRVHLPVRTLTISLTMFKSRVFLVKSCDTPDLRSKILRMSGTVVSNFKKHEPNVVVTDRGDRKYCIAAFKNKIAVVSKDWVDKNYNKAMEEDTIHFNHHAMTTVEEHRVKPFFGLYFRIEVKDSDGSIKRMIIENGGRIIFGDQNCLTHIVGPPKQNSSTGSTQDATSQGPKKPKYVDIDFLKACVEHGHYLRQKDYLQKPKVIIKLEKPSTPPKVIDENSTPPLIPYNLSGNSTMPPPINPRSHREPDRMNDIILKALSTIETTQTQMPSTQMRRLPDPELRIEQTFEPSQQLYWNDSTSRRS